MLDHLVELGRIDQRLSMWFRGGDSLDDARSKPIPLESGPIETLLLEGRNRRDNDASVIEELGYGMSGWNEPEATTGQARFSVRCAVTSTRVPNDVLVDVPGSPDPDDTASGERTRQLAAATAATWRPDWATCSTDRLRREQGAKAAGRIVLGRHTYLSDDRGAVPQLPAPCVATRVGIASRAVV